MLIIRDEQLAALQRQAREQFAQRLREHLAAHFPDLVAAMGGEQALADFVAWTMERAADCRIETEGGVTILAELFAQFGEAFERSPIREWALVILEHPTLVGDLKVETIRDRHDEITGGRVVLYY